MTDKEKYPDFIETTGYGEIQGLLGINCRHTFYPYFGDGDEEPLVDKEESARLYELSQEQRALERNVRRWKRRQQVATTDEDKKKSDYKVKFYQHKLRNLMDDNKELRRDYLREKI